MESQDAPTPQPRKRVTSADVAKASGVSRATVSYVLNSAPGRMISESTRKLVLETAQRLGHVPYAPARTLRLGSSNIVLALVRDFAFGFVSNTVLRQLDTALAQRGYVVLAHRFDESVRPLSELWGLVSPNVVVAMGGLTLPEQEIIEESHAKLVRIHGIVDQSRAGEMQVDYLYSKGHRRLGYAFAGNQSVQLVAVERLEGARRACRRLGLPEPAVETIDLDDPTTVYPALDAWARLDPPITAICAHNDEVGMMLSDGLTSRGLRAGTDLDVIGIDNIPLARNSLTTIEMDVDAYADAIVAAVLAAIDDRPAPENTGELLRLIVRHSA
jgi:DNA-binding LacI/PurR family transcriptional regulator